MEKKLIITGCQRSGTTLVASCVGRHSEVNMLNESLTDDFLKLMGKTYQANKLTAGYQLQIKKKKNYRLLNKVLYTLRKFGLKIRVPIYGKYTIKELNDMGCVFIYVRRDKESLIRSMMDRGGLTFKQALNNYNKSIDVLKSLFYESNSMIVVDYNNFVRNPKNSLLNICNHLEIKYEEEMLNGAKFTHFYRHERILSEKANKV